jgi:hypothetical protein
MFSAQIRLIRPGSFARLADGYDGIEVVEINLAGNLPRSFGLNYSNSSNSCQLI